MRVMNKRMNLPNMQKILMEFEKQNERMEMTSDMMGDAIDDAMEVRSQQQQQYWAYLSENNTCFPLHNQQSPSASRLALGTDPLPPTHSTRALAAVSPVLLLLLVCVCCQGEGEEEETDELISQVLDEIGISTTAQVGGAGTAQLGLKRTVWFYGGGGRGFVKRGAVSSPECLIMLA